MARLKLAMFALFFTALSLPGLQMLFEFAEEEKLHGVVQDNGKAFPEFSFDAVTHEKFQQAFLAWWDRTIGYRGFFVRTDNQINFSVFSEISTNYASPVTLGRNSNLFEKLYIDNENGTGFVSDKDLRRTSRNLGELQRQLAARGIAFMLLISPSKASIHRTDVPARWLRDDAPPYEKTNYARLLPLLAEEKVQVLDGRALLQSWSDSPFPRFPKGGTHWSQFTACKVGALLLERLRQQGLSTLGNLECEPYEVKPVPEPFDRDLADLCNLWEPAPFYQPLPYPLPGAATGGRAKMLFVGGSFLWSIFHYFDLEHVYEKRDMLYYYSRRFRFPDRSETPIVRSAIDWEGDIFSNDAIVIEVNEANIRTLGSGFVSDAVRALDKPSVRH